MPVFLEAYRAGLFGHKHWINNIISGVIVGVVSLPLGMAFAIASGAAPVQGIYTSIIAGFIVSTMGGSRLQIAGPTGAFIVILAGVVSQHGIIGLQIATIMAGVILLLLGVARMGVIIKYIPSPVIVGFTAGIAVTIWIGQWENFFNLKIPAGDYTHFYQKFMGLIQSFRTLDIPTTLLSLISLILIFLTPKIPYIRRIPGPLIALVFATLALKLLKAYGIDNIPTISSAYGSIPSGLPSFKVPTFDLNALPLLIAPAFTIAMLGAIESLLSAVVADNMSGQRHNSNQELIGQGLANIITPFFGGFAATGAIARTAANIKNGGNSPLSGIIHCFVLVLVILFLAPLADDVPLAVLAAILFSVAWNMSQAKVFLIMGKRAPKSDVAILIVTFALTVFVDLVVAVNIGVILAIFQFLRRMANSVEINPIPKEELEEQYKDHGITQSLSDILVLAVEGPIFFGVAENFERAFNAIYASPDTINPHVMIIDLRRVPFIDYTGLEAMASTIKHIQKQKVRVILTGANHKVDRKIKKADLLKLIHEENYFKHMLSALIFCQQLSLKSAEADAMAHVEAKALADKKSAEDEKVNNAGVDEEEKAFLEKLKIKEVPSES